MYQGRASKCSAAKDFCRSRRICGYALLSFCFVLGLFFVRASCKERGPVSSSLSFLFAAILVCTQLVCLCMCAVVSGSCTFQTLANDIARSLSSVLTGGASQSKNKTPNESSPIADHTLALFSMILVFANGFPLSRSLVGILQYPLILGPG